MVVFLPPFSALSSYKAFKVLICNEFAVFLMEAQSRAHSIEKSHSVALSRLRLPVEKQQIYCRLQQHMI